MFRKVAVGVSGGVDSAVTALMLKKSGFEVEGVFMRNWDLSDEAGTCSVSQDVEDAKYVCDKLDIPFREVNFVKQYWVHVFEYLTAEYQAGRTPNPDIICNKKIKFDLFFKHVSERLGADALATGHYANSSFGPYLERYDPCGNARLLKAKDPLKDQTFFLSQIPQVALRRSMFPLGEMTKERVKRIALEHGLGRIARKKESMGICFIGLRNFKRFLSDYVVSKPGNFVNLATGETVGQHEGIHLWTLGQGCRLGGINHPLFVAAKNLETNEIYVVPGTKHPCLYSDLVYTTKPYWIAPAPPPSAILSCQFRFQHTKPLVGCSLLQLNSGEMLVKLDRPLKALTPGQYGVFYKDDECLGSARIIKPGPSYHSRGKVIEMDYKEYDLTRAC